MNVKSGACFDMFPEIRNGSVITPLRRFLMEPGIDNRIGSPWSRGDVIVFQMSAVNIAIKVSSGVLFLLSS